MTVPPDTVLGLVLVSITWVGLVYFACSNAIQTGLVLSAAIDQYRMRGVVREQDTSRLRRSSITPMISIVAPAHNEETTVTESVRALLTLTYPRLEVVVVNDGSSDDTLDVLVDAFALRPVPATFRQTLTTQRVRGLYRSATHPGLVVVDKENGGKADALNAGLNIGSGELVCAIDADTLIETDALLHVVRPFIDDDRTIASGGTICTVNGSRVHNGRVVHAQVPTRWLAGTQTVEYLRAFLFGRLGWNRLGGNLIISGAFGLFRAGLVLDAGGYLHGSVGEDMELVARLRRVAREKAQCDRVVFVPDPVAWTEVPEDLQVLGRQRERWQRGLFDTLVRHRALVGRPRYGALGLVVTPYFVLVELLGPLIEVAAPLALVAAAAGGVLSAEFVALFLAVWVGWAILLGLVAILLEQAGNNRYPGVRSRLLLIVWTVCEQLGYRQLTLYWRIKGMWRYLRKRTDWGHMTRRGFTTPAHPDRS